MALDPATLSMLASLAGGLAGGKKEDKDAEFNNFVNSVTNPGKSSIQDAMAPASSSSPDFSGLMSLLKKPPVATTLPNSDIETDEEEMRKRFGGLQSGSSTSNIA